MSEVSLASTAELAFDLANESLPHAPLFFVMPDGTRWGLTGAKRSTLAGEPALEVGIVALNEEGHISNPNEDLVEYLDSL